MDPGDNSELDKALPCVIDNIESFLNRRLPTDAESRRTINAVPSNLRGVHNNSFDPEMIGIAPFRQSWQQEKSSSWLRVIREHKVRFLNRLLEGKLERHRRDKNLQRTTDDGKRKEVLLDGLAKAMWTSEHEIKACYSTNFNHHDTTLFVGNIIINGCVVIELLRIGYDLHNRRIDRSAIEDDPILTNPRILATLRRDLLLLQNQLPFFVLDKLYEVINKKNNVDHQQAVPLEKLAVTFFAASIAALLPGRHAASELDIGQPNARHLLDVVHSTFLQSVSEKVHKNPVKGSTACLVLHFASELEEAGVRFKKWKGHGILDIEFGRRTLRVPPLTINDHTISLLLNCVAYELTVDHPHPIFTNYLTFWTSLVNSPGDVQILHNCGIINNAWGSNTEVANLLIKCRAVVYNCDLGYLYDEIKKMNEYCEQHKENKCQVWWRSLIRERFSSPWTGISLFAASILLILTMLQTIYTVYPYYRPR